MQTVPGKNREKRRPGSRAPAFHCPGNVLLIGAEVHGGFMPWRSWDVVLGHSDRAVSAEERAWNTRFRDRTVLFGDGAGAFVISAGGDGGDGGRGLEDVIVHADGAHVDKMWINGGGSAHRPYPGRSSSAASRRRGRGTSSSRFTIPSPAAAVINSPGPRRSSARIGPPTRRSCWLATWAGRGKA